MPTYITPIMLVKRPSDTEQASFEDCVCLAGVTGPSEGLSVFEFLDSNTFEDTQTLGA